MLKDDDQIVQSGNSGRCDSLVEIPDSLGASASASGRAFLRSLELRSQARGRSPDALLLLPNPRGVALRGQECLQTNEL